MQVELELNPEMTIDREGHCSLADLWLPAWRDDLETFEFARAERLKHECKRTEPGTKARAEWERKWSAWWNLCNLAQDEVAETVRMIRERGGLLFLGVK